MKVMCTSIACEFKIHPPTRFKMVAVHFVSIVSVDRRFYDIIEWIEQA